MFLFHSIYLFIILLFLSSFLPSFLHSFLPFSPACTTVQVHITQIIEGINAVLYDVMKPVVATFNFQTLPELASADVVSCVLFE
jgi:hypothetical protein